MKLLLFIISIFSYSAELHQAIVRQAVPVVEVILETIKPHELNTPSMLFRTPLETAFAQYVKTGHADAFQIFEMIIKKNKSLRGDQILDELKYATDDGKMFPMLFVAVAHKNILLVKTLLKLGADVNEAFILDGKPQTCYDYIMNAYYDAMEITAALTLSGGKSFKDKEPVSSQACTLL